MAETIKKSADPNAGFKTPEKKSIMPAHLPSPVKVYTSNIGRSRAPSLRWEVPEWDLIEAGRIVDTEAYVRRAFKVKKNLFVKEGYEFSGSNIDRIRYIKRRFQQMEFASGIPLPVLMSQTIGSLIRTSNAFWVKVRKESASGGKVRFDSKGRSVKPIAGYFLLPAETVRFKRDEYGKIVKYAQEVWGKELREFKPEDVVHFYFDKREGFAVGTPIIVPVKDDIRALRRIEENVELLVYQHLFPLFHYQVGTPEAPAATFSDGTTEIDVVKVRIAQMPSDGCWVTPERHKITPLQASSSPIAVDNVIEHFKQRIFTGLGVSSVDMGEGGTSNRSTAQTMSRNLIDDTKADQKEFGALFYSFIIQELLLESTFPQATLLDEENRVYLKFKEIDFEARQAKENHAADMFLKNAITHSELRQSLGHEPFQGEGWRTSSNKKEMFSKGDGDWANTNYGLIERDKIILQSVDEPGTEASKALTASASSSAGGKSVSNKNQPTNQHGTRSSAKINKDSMSKRLKEMGSLPLQQSHKELQNDIVRMIKNGATKKVIKNTIGMSFDSAKNQLVRVAQNAFRNGLMDNNRQVWEVPLSDIDLVISNHITYYSDKLRDEFFDHLDRNLSWNKNLVNEDVMFANLVFDSLNHRINMIDSSEIDRAYNYGTARAHRLNGAKVIRSFRQNTSDCAICNQVLSYNQSDAIIYSEIPPLHPHCECTMGVEK